MRYAVLSCVGLLYLTMLGLGLTSQLFPLTLFLHPSHDLAVNTPFKLEAQDMPGFVIVTGEWTTASKQTLWAALEASPPSTRDAFNISLGRADEVQKGILVPVQENAPECGLPLGDLRMARFFYDSFLAAQDACNVHHSAAYDGVRMGYTPLRNGEIRAARMYLGVSRNLRKWAENGAWLHYVAGCMGIVLFVGMLGLLAVPSIKARLASLPSPEQSLLALVRSAALTMEAVFFLFVIFVVLFILTALRDAMDLPELSFFIYMVYLASGVTPCVVAVFMMVALHATRNRARIAPDPDSDPADAAEDVENGEEGGDGEEDNREPFDLGVEGVDDPMPGAGHYCSLCMMYFPSMYQTSCCGQSTCGSCANEYFEVAEGEAYDPTQLRSVFPDVACAFCTRTDDWEYGRVVEAARPTYPEETPFKPRGREAAALANYSPLAIGAGVEDMKRKMIQYSDLQTPARPVLDPSDPSDPSDHSGEGGGDGEEEDGGEDAGDDGEEDDVDGEEGGVDGEEEVDNDVDDVDGEDDLVKDSAESASSSSSAQSSAQSSSTSSDEESIERRDVLSPSKEY